MKKALALVLVLTLVVTMAFSALLLLSHRHHRCEGENCRICASVCEKIMKASGILLAVILLFPASCRLAERTGLCPAVSRGGFTLIALKVKLSD